MLTLYFSKGSSALAAHILLEEVQATYRATHVPIRDGAHQSPEFARVNPKMRIPALGTPDGVLTENPAILEYIAEAFPDARMQPEGRFARAEARALAAYLCATVHVGFAHLKRGSRWAAHAASLADMTTHAPSVLAACADHLEAQLPLAPWALGPAYTYCDAYLFLLGKWMAEADLTLQAHPRLAAHHARMSERPATRAALAAHAAEQA